MSKSLYFFVVAAFLFFKVSGCRDDPVLPPTDIEKRNQLLAEVERQFAFLQHATVEQVIHLLKHPDDRVRSRAARRLSEMRASAKHSTPYLIDLLSDPNRDVRIEAAYALGSVGDDAALVPLIRTLMDDDRKVRLWALKGLRKFGDRAIPAIIESFGNDSPLAKLQYEDEAGNKHGIRATLREHLVDLGGKAVPLLIKGVDHRDPRVQSNCVTTLGDIGPPAKDAIDALVNILEHSGNNALRRYAVISLGKIGDLNPTVTPAVLKASRDRDKKLAIEAKKTLDHFRKEARAKKK